MSSGFLDAPAWPEPGGSEVTGHGTGHDRVGRAISQLIRGAGWSPELPEWREDRVVCKPVPLGRLTRCRRAITDEVPHLSRGSAQVHLMRRGIACPEIPGDPAAPLAGFILVYETVSYALVCREVPLVRRRFTMAHQLGHVLLHNAGRAPYPGGAEGPMVPSGEPAIVVEDAKAALDEEGDAALGARPNLPWMETEANEFAARLLLPETTMRALCDLYMERYGQTARFIESHIASHLLVSRPTVRRRLRDLALDAGADRAALLGEEDDS